MKRIFYTDGSNTKNGFPDSIGGWAFIELDHKTLSNILLKVKGRVGITPEPNTNNKMELRAIIEALKSCDPGDEVILYSDSAYCVNGIKQKWYLRWFRTGRNSNGDPAANLDLWRELVGIADKLKKFNPIHLRGHNGDLYNEICDSMASSMSSVGDETIVTIDYKDPSRVYNIYR